MLFVFLLLTRGLF